MARISVILLAWIRNDELYWLTGETLASLKSSEGWNENCELIIVDNGSPIGGDQLLPQADIYIRNKENLGYPKAVNQGYALATGEFICVANNDIRVSPNWIPRTLEVMEKLKDVGSLHFKMVDYNAPFNLGNAVWAKGKERWCHGSFFVWRREAVDEIEGWKVQGKKGVLDEGYGLGGYDDWDWHHRLNHLRAWRSAYTNGVAFQHKDSSTLNTLEQGPRSESDKKNREYFKEKFGKYPEEIWEEKYASQMLVPWKPFP